MVFGQNERPREGEGKQIQNEKKSQISVNKTDACTKIAEKANSNLAACIPLVKWHEFGHVGFICNLR